MMRSLNWRLVATHSLVGLRVGAIAIIASVAVLSSLTRASTIVDDHWNNGARTNPPPTLTAPYSTTYSENGVDQDSSGDISSAWFAGGSGVSMSASTGQMVLNAGSSSFFGITYFTPPSSKVTLTNPGDKMVLSWTFTTGSTIASGDTSQRMYYTLVDSSAVSRITVDGAGTPSGQFPGYAILANMSTPLGNSSPFQLREWGGVSGALFGTSGQWAAESPNVNDGTNSNNGYAANTQYTMTWTLTRGATSDLLVDVTMAGGSLNGSGQLHVSYDDPSPSSFSFDTFGLRSNSGPTTTNSFTTTHFSVVLTVPEPSTIVLLGIGLAVFGCRKIGRRNISN